jgi:hypothetical protein
VKCASARQKTITSIVKNIVCEPSCLMKQPSHLPEPLLPVPLLPEPLQSPKFLGARSLRVSSCTKC